MNKKNPILFFDTASPRSSVAVGSARRVLASRSFELRQASEQLLDSISEVLGDAKLHLADLGGVAALQGPGSFTGLRIGLATALGFHQALGLATTALPTLPVLALAARDWLAARATTTPTVPPRVIAAVDAMRNEYFAQVFVVGQEVRGLDSPRLWSLAELEASGLPVIGSGMAELPRQNADPTPWIEPPPLAPLALRLVTRAAWEASRLIQPIYFRAPAVTLPASRNNLSNNSVPSAPSEVATP